MFLDMNDHRIITLSLGNGPETFLALSNRIGLRHLLRHVQIGGSPSTIIVAAAKRKRSINPVP
jgi:hypothetical protein